MREIQYKNFSLRTHRKNWLLKRPNVCQFELTFRCNLHCKHCYTDCYNKPAYLVKELNTREVKFILGKIYDAGIIWLCFTGGDPLERDDFLDIYSYAKNKGFIITIFTNGYSMRKEILDCLERKPPFVIEITLNAIIKETYEKISGIEWSFEKTIKGINLILERKLPLKIKTQVTKDNFQELPRIRQFIENLGLNFRPSSFLYARLNGDLTPCSLRILPEEVSRLNGKRQLLEDDCRLLPKTGNRKPITELFLCTIGGGDGINVDPYGYMFPCTCIREPKVDLLEESIEQARKTILSWVRARRFTTDSKCKNCSIREFCYNCAGKALLEKGSLEEPIEWFCELAHFIAKKQMLNC